MRGLWRSPNELCSTVFVPVFQTALANKPADPLALVGRSHAELGAGIYAAAAYDLKFVFTRKPGIIAVKYDAQSLIPGPPWEQTPRVPMLR